METVTNQAEPLKKAYETPRIESEEVLEQAALSCSHYAFPNPYYNVKDNSIVCGFNDS